MDRSGRLVAGCALLASCVFPADAAPVAAGFAAAGTFSPEPDPAHADWEVRLLDAIAVESFETVGFNDWPVGGLSAIDCLSQFKTLGDLVDGVVQASEAGLEFAIVSDDRAELAPARIGVLQLRIHESEIESIGAVTWRALTDEHGARFDTDRVDPEGVRFFPEAGVGFWSSEGRTKEGEPTAIFQIDREGETRRLPLPKGFVADHSSRRAQTVGVRNNRGFEALAAGTLSQGFRNLRVYAGLEAPLAQDESSEHTVSRVVVYKPERRAGGTSGMVISAVNLYPLGPAPDGWADAENGLTELVWVGPSRLLALERGERVVEGTPHYNIRLYWVSTEGAADVTEAGGFGDTVLDELPPMIMKKLLLDFDTIAGHLPGGRIPNFEGMTRLLGNQLLLISDNSHGEEGPTVFVLLQLPSGLDR